MLCTISQNQNVLINFCKFLLIVPLGVDWIIMWFSFNNFNIITYNCIQLLGCSSLYSWKNMPNIFLHEFQYERIQKGRSIIDFMFNLKFMQQKWEWCKTKEELKWHLKVSVLWLTCAWYLLSELNNETGLFINRPTATS